MEKEEQKLEQAEVEEEEAQETTPLVRKSRNGDDSKIVAVHAVDGGVSNGVSVSNGHAVQSEMVQNGAENEELIIPAAEEQKIEKIDWVLENGSEAINGEQKIEDSDRVLKNEAEAINGEKNSENLVFHDKVEGKWKCRICTWTYGNGSVSVDHIQDHRGLGVISTSTFICKTLIVEGPAHAKDDDSSLDPTIHFNGTSVINNQYEEEIEENGNSGANVQPSDIASQEGVKSTSTYIIREPFLKGPVKYDVSSLDLAHQSNGTAVINNQYEKEIEKNGTSSSNVEPSDSSSQGGVNSTSTYIIGETILLKGPARYDVSSLDQAIQSNGTTVINDQYEEEIKENGISSSNVQHSDSSSQEGVKSTSTLIGETVFLKGPAKYGIPSLDPVIQFNGTSVINNQYEEEIEENDIFSSNVWPSKSLPQEGRTSYEPSNEIRNAETDLINEDDLEITESDVERVIQKQTTHDLYCPNCKSCITKRVILSKRKRRIRIPDEEVKRPKTGTAPVGTVSPEDQVNQEDGVGNYDAQIPTVDEDERDRGPDIFRCLSCFSIFIPTGDGFKLFRVFGGKSGKENEQDEQAPDMKKSWISKIFTPNRQNTAVEKGSSSQTNVQQVSSAIPSSDPARESGQPLVSQYNGSPARASEGVEGTNSETVAYEGRDLTLPDLYHLKLPLLVGSTGVAQSAVITADQQMESKPSQEVLTNRDKDVIQLPPPSASTIEASDLDGTLNISLSIPHEEQDVRATIVATSVLENKNVDSRSSDDGKIYPAEVPQQMTTTTTFDFRHDKPLITGFTSEIGDAPPDALGNDTRITIDTHPPALPHIDEGTIPLTVSQPETQSSTADRERSEAREERKIEVIKSIVYGGLAESMTSLSVVSAAAGGGAATLNVLAMGAANLIGGLFIISHNLWDLRCDRVEEQLSNQITEPMDRYKQLLGQRQNFMLHAVVAIISYIIFGLVSPVVYGFSFRESDDKLLKLVVVAAAALVCILVLAVGKAYVQRPPKPYLKTIMTFMILGIMVSGVSYAAGGLVERLLEKLGLFETSTAAPNLLVPEMRPVGSGWSSY